MIEKGPGPLGPRPLRGHSPALAWISLVGLLLSRRRALRDRMVDEELACSGLTCFDGRKDSGS
jgi:hypothetical protein